MITNEQIIVSLSSGPLDNAFDGGNLPAFIMGSIAAVFSGILAFIFLPASDQRVNATFAEGGGH